MPLSVRLAAYLYFATAAISGLLAVVLIAMSRLPWPFLFILLAFDGIPVWLGISLLQRVRGALIIARILTGLAVVSSLTTVTNTRSIVGQPWTSAFRVLALMIQLIILVALFWPSTGAAFNERRTETSAKVINEGS